MGLKHRPVGLLPQVEWGNPLTRGLKFVFLPGILRDIVGNLVITKGSAVAEGFGPRGRRVTNEFAFGTSADWLTASCPVSSGDASFLCVAVNNTGPAASVGAPFGITALAGDSEFFMHVSDLVYVGPFASTRWVNGVAFSGDTRVPYVYSGSMASGATNGAKVWGNTSLLQTSTITNAFPASIGIVGPSSTAIGVSTLNSVFLAMIWNRSLLDAEMRDLQEDPWQVLRTSRKVSFYSMSEVAASGNLLKQLQHHGAYL